MIRTSKNILLVALVWLALLPICYMICWTIVFSLWVETWSDFEFYWICLRSFWNGTGFEIPFVLGLYSLLLSLPLAAGAIFVARRIVRRFTKEPD